jgi:hypothetical protein
VVKSSTLDLVEKKLCVCVCFVFLPCWDGTQGREHTRQVLYHTTDLDFNLCSSPWAHQLTSP